MLQEYTGEKTTTKKAATAKHHLLKSIIIAFVIISVILDINFISVANETRAMLTDFLIDK